MDYSIRPATVADLPLLCPLAEKFYASTRNLTRFELPRFVAFWSAMIDSGNGVVLLAIEGGAIVGTLGGVDYPDLYDGRPIATELFWFVDPEHRGVGTQLYKPFERWARDRLCVQIRMGFLHDSMPEKLTVVYRRWGFRPIETHWGKELSE